MIEEKKNCTWGRMKDVEGIGSNVWTIEEGAASKSLIAYAHKEIGGTRWY